MLGPIADAALAFSLENLRASNGDLREAGRLLFFRAQAKNCFRKQNFFPGAIIHKEHPVPCRFQIQRAAGSRSGSSCRLAHIADGERIFQKRRILLNLVGNQFFFWRFFRRGGSLPFERQRTEPRARSNRTPCAGTFAPARAELARAPGSARKPPTERQSARECEGSLLSSEAPQQMVKGKD